MTDKRHLLQRYAMYCGTYLGAFWIIKFVFLPLGLTYMFCMFLFMSLTLGVPFIAYHFLKGYRDKVCMGEIDFLNGWLFTVFMYMFASLLTAVAHYIYFRYIDQGYFVEHYQILLDKLLAVNDVPGMEAYVDIYRERMDEAISLLHAQSAIDMTLGMLSRNVFYGSLLAIPTALIARRKKPTGVASKL